MGLTTLGATAFLALLSLGTIKSGSCTKGVCQFTHSSLTYKEVDVVQYRRRSHRFRYACGWWNWGRCIGTRYSRVSFTQTTSVSEIQYRQVTACCTGYVGQPPNCTVYCPDGLTTEECSNATCVFLTDPNNGTISCSLGDDGVPSHNDTCSYTCDSGYEVSGSNTWTCQSNGTWSDNDAVCVRVRCPSLSPDNGVITCSLGDDGVPSFEDTCSFTCDTGYELTGSNTSTCQSDGSWSGTEAMCRRVPCPLLFTPNNGTINCSTGEDGIPSYEDTCSFTCNTGYELYGDVNRTCESEGNWTGIAATCIQLRVNCTILADPPNGAINCTMDETDPFCNFSCNTGYELTGSDTRTCQIDGSWSGTDATCTIVQCPQLTNGNLHCPNKTTVGMFEDSCAFSCYPGYQLQGPNGGACLANGSWSGGDPICEPLNCAPSPPLDNSQLQLPCDALYQTTCNTTCVNGYIGEGGFFTCVVTDVSNNGVGWSGLTDCKRVQCPELAMPTNGLMSCSLINTALFSYEDTCNSTCNTGYKLTGNSNRVCQASGRWSGTATNCTTGTVCRSENDTIWGIEWTDVPIGSVATQGCPDGLSGEASRICLQNGQWEDVNVTQCTNMELVLLDSQAADVLSIFVSSNTDTSSAIKEVQAISVELTTLTSTSDRPLVPNDINTSNNVLNSLISVISHVGDDMQNSTLDNVEPLLESITSTIDNLLNDSNMASFDVARNMQLSVGEDLLQNTENFATAVGDILSATANANITNRTEITIKRDNIILNAQLPPENTELIDDIVFPSVGDTRVLIPAGAIIHQRSGKNTIEPVVSFVANNLQQYLADGSLSENSRISEGKIISSQISATSIQLPPNSTVQLSFNSVGDDSNIKNFQCVFWDFNLSNSNGQTVGGWSSEGILQDSSTGLPVLCNTTHLTSFAVLVSNGGSEGSQSLRIVSYVGCGISILCLILTIIVIMLLRKKGIKEKHQIVHLNLSVALLLALIAFVSGLETARNNTPGCIFVTTLLHYLFLAVFSWSLCEGMMVFAMFRVPFYKGFFQRLLFYHLVGWGLPVPIVIISAGVSHDNYGLYSNDRRWACWISDEEGAIWAFTAPMIVIITVNYVLLIVSLFEIYKARKYHQKMTVNEQSRFDTARTILYSIMALLPLLGGTWILGLLFLFDSDSEPLAWIFTIMNSLQILSGIGKNILSSALNIMYTGFVPLRVVQYFLSRDKK